MRKKSSSAPESRAQFSNVFDDIFGMKAWQSRKNHRDKKSIPWQWALWGALAFFAVGYLIPTDSVWILLVAVAAAVIFYLARSTETVNEQVLLLTDARSPSQKAAHKERAARAQKAQATQSTAGTRRKPGRKPAAKAQAETAPAATAETPAPAPRKRGRRPKAKVLAAAQEAQVADTATVDNVSAPAQATVTAQDGTPVATPAAAPRRRGRKPGSKNKPKPATDQTAQGRAKPRRPRKPRQDATASAVTTSAEAAPESVTAQKAPAGAEDTQA